jgi:hypothetical protein
MPPYALRIIIIIIKRYNKRNKLGIMEEVLLQDYREAKVK